MKKFKVSIIFSTLVEAKDRDEAEDKAYADLDNLEPLFSVEES